MKEKNNSNILSLSRYRYFQVCISGDQLFSNLPSISTPRAFFKGLIEQALLEDTLFNLKINDKKREISLEDFKGQLEQDSIGMPYWHIIAKTSWVITKRLLAKTLSQDLFEKKNGIHPKIKVTALASFGELRDERIFCTEISGFCLGFLTRNFLMYQFLGEQEEVKKLLRMEKRIDEKKVT